MNDFFRRNVEILNEEPESDAARESGNALVVDGFQTHRPQERIQLLLIIPEIQMRSYRIE